MNTLKQLIEFNLIKNQLTFISASKDGKAKLFDTKSFQCLKTYDTGRPINASTISPIKDHVIVGGGESAQFVTQTKLDTSQFRMRFFHKIYENELGSITGHFGPVNALSFSPDGKSFSSGAEDGYVRVHHFDEGYLNSSDDDSNSILKREMKIPPNNNNNNNNNTTTTSEPNGFH